jgi:hypothetical protein
VDSLLRPGLTLGELAEAGTWRALTAVEQKFREFSVEAYVRESWAQATPILGEDILASLQRVAMLVLKPDCIAGRKGIETLEYMREQGFRPVVAEVFRYDRHKAREIWRFQWNIATLDRLQLGDLLHTVTDALIVLFVDERGEPGVPGSVRLAGLKGSSLPWERKDFHLRTRLGALNRMVVFTHCSDEPVDIVRELGILLDTGRLDGVYRRLAAVLRGEQQGDDVDAAVRKLYTGFPQRSLDVAAAVERLRARLGSVDGVAGEPAAAERAARALDAACAGEKLNWRTWSDDLRQAGLDPSDWDSVLVATQYILHDRPGIRCVISESGRERWLAGEGLPLGC